MKHGYGFQNKVFRIAMAALAMVTLAVSESRSPVVQRRSTDFSDGVLGQLMVSYLFDISI